MTSHTETPTRIWAPWAITMDGDPVESALIELDGQVIGDISSVAKPPADALVVADAVIAPGFINAHSHLEYSFFDGIIDGLPFSQWLPAFRACLPHLDDDDVLTAARHGAWESVAGGITTTLDCTYFGHAATAMHEIGMRGRAYLEVFNTAADDATASRPSRNVNARRDELNGLPSDARIEAGWSPHASYTVARDLFEQVAADGLPWATHLAESPEEMAWMRNGDGPLADMVAGGGITAHQHSPSPIAALGDLLSPASLVVHAVHATPDDIGVLARASAPVALCPRSNARLGCGTAPYRDLRSAGVALALGTDSPASAGPIDMFDEMRTLLAVQRAGTGDAAVISANEALHLATRGGAAAIGMPAAGWLRRGGPADLQVIHTGPTADPVNAVVLRGAPSDVRMTMVDGRIVWSDVPDYATGVDDHERTARACELMRPKLELAVRSSQIEPAGV